MGLFIGVELVRDRGTLEAATNEAGYLARKLKDHKIFVSTDGPLDNVLKIKPPMCFTLENADTVCDTLATLLAGLQGRSVTDDGVVCYGASSKGPPKPALGSQAIPDMVHAVFGLRCTVISDLPSYADQNFLVQEEGANNLLVIKISNACESAVNLDVQARAMQFLCDRGIRVQRPVSNTLGDPVSFYGGYHFRGVHHLQGEVFSSLDEASQVAPALLADFGVQLAKLDLALMSFGYPPSLQPESGVWDLKNSVAVVTENLSFVSRKDLVQSYVQKFKKYVIDGGILTQLRSSLIHGDANDHNVLVDRATLSVSGFIDFGDMAESYTINDLAICLAYVAMKANDPLDVCAQVTRAYHSVLPLTDAELQALFPLMCMRLCVSVTMCSKTLAQNPGDEYISVSQEGAWRLLEDFNLKDFEEVRQYFVTRIAQ